MTEQTEQIIPIDGTFKMLNIDPIKLGTMSSYFGVYFELEPHETVRHSFLRWMKAQFTEYPIINLTIEAPCGEKVFYKTIDDLPEVDTPCTCGNPNHWFIKIKRSI